MTEETQVLGLTMSTWTVLGIVSSAVAALGTLLAVAITLWLVRYRQKFRGKLLVGRSTMLPGNRDYLTIQLVNNSDRSFKVTSLGWRLVPRDPDGRFYQVIEDDPYAPQSPLPMLLEPGNDGHWYISLGNHDWFQSSMEHQNKRPRRVYLDAAFADGTLIERRVSRSLLKDFQAGFDSKGKTTD